ncbi:hypothetical protein BDA96_01G393600 [Sorghum bicolor]|uniref:Uncharacterized protein n=1 Tax=Sorghum bicolor TaxID=4558 RepID=A0A921S3R9_SORBI|nr:hypothetical protein BDA96_01G393600 [Sorghum bicolor]
MHLPSLVRRDRPPSSQCSPPLCARPLVCPPHLVRVLVSRVQLSSVLWHYPAYLPGMCGWAAHLWRHPCYTWWRDLCEASMTRSKR